MKKQRIAISGASGFVGSYLSRILESHGCKIIPLGRHELALSPEQLADIMRGVDTVVNLAGAPVIKRWTESYKKTMYASRIGVTENIIEACRLSDRRPDTFISASAVGYYAPGGPHTEKNYKQADDFLGQLSGDWEHEALKAGDLGIRTIIFRFGIVLGRNGGALQQMLPPFKMGIGGTIGDGTQPFSWIHLRDLAHALETAIDDRTFKGIYNLTAPEPTTNRGLTQALGRALGRPAIMPVPLFILRMKFGEGAQVLASGQEVLPERLLEHGFSFSFTDIDHAVKDCVS